MWKRALFRQPVWRMLSSRSSTTTTNSSSSTTISSAVDSILLRSLKEHYLEVSRMNPPPRVSPPSGFVIMKGALDGNGPVLTRTYGEEQINISVMRMANVIPGGGEDNDDGDDINQLFLHVDVSKPGLKKSLHFLCGLYPDALGIHSVSMRSKVEVSDLPSEYNGPLFEELDERMRDALHNYIEERGVNESLFNFLQAWLYVKEHRSLMRWFKTAGTFINEKKSS
ncbi:uncharacterized protein At2g39795, mitochondrial [Mercurialis annua]|uniref:uncharacterized protein At2g39795, mitochondrial n=1 Tax=Mercurialis annua TaxID=3986 RepID=UPI002160B608|nr:uncharacterized protein At2g39795, mitochondrial [Mercurialis annua]